MPLTTDCKSVLGCNVFVLPYYGYGWGRQDLPDQKKTALESLGPEPFHLHLDEFVYCNEHIMGVSGWIEEREHEFAGYWCCCLLRNPDDCDLTRRAGDYLVWIAKKKLQIDPAPYPEKALGEWIKSDKSQFGLCGFGMVAESVEWVKHKYDLAMSARKLAREEEKRKLD